ncbi:hypothetical protein [Ralstonia pseudosolanacearum]
MRVADAHAPREQLERVLEARAGFEAALHAEGEQSRPGALPDRDLWPSA